MNKKLMVSILTLMTIIIAACTMKTTGDKQSAYSPSKAVENFYISAKSGELDEAKKYVASEVLDYYEKNANGLSGTLSYAMSDEGSRYKEVRAKEEKINGQTAIVTVEITGKSDETFEKDYSLIKEEDGWKLLFQ